MRYSLSKLHHQYRSLRRKVKQRNANTPSKTSNNVSFLLFYHDFLSASLPRWLQLSFLAFLDGFSTKSKLYFIALITGMILLTKEPFNSMDSW